MTALTLASKRVRSGAQLAYWALGSIIILLAVLSYLTQMTLADLLSYIERLFGVTFIFVFSLLVALAAWSVNKIYIQQNIDLWAETGLQAANGISTLALTFTLLGISLGIGSLAQQALTPDTVQEIIGQLTAQFSMAFMTTVVGLPTATLFRAVISILCVKQQTKNGMREREQE